MRKKKVPIIAEGMMKAMVLRGLDEPLVYEEIEIPEPEPGEVLIKIHATSINHRDIWIQKGKYPGVKFPIILGSDAAGVITALGDLVEKQWLGQEVIINPGMNWGEDPKVQSPEFRVLGLPRNGTFAQYISIPVEYVFPKPEKFTFEQAATLPLAGVTAYRAVFTKAKLRRGESIFITGIGGGVAQFVLQYALAIGAKVYSSSSSYEKLARTRDRGAIGYAYYPDEDWADIFLDKYGQMDVIIDGTAGDNFAHLANIAAPGGRIVMYGGTLGAINKLSPQKIFWKQLTIMGSTMGSREDFKSMLHFVEEHEIRPPVDTVIPLEEAQSGIERILSREQHGKVILTPWEK